MPFFSQKMFPFHFANLIISGQIISLCLNGCVLKLFPQFYLKIHPAKIYQLSKVYRRCYTSKNFILHLKKLSLIKNSSYIILFPFSYPIFEVLVCWQQSRFDKLLTLKLNNEMRMSVFAECSIILIHRALHDEEPGPPF